MRKYICEQCTKGFSFDFETSEKLNEFFAGDEHNLHYAKLSDMLDFSRTEFDKAIKLNEIKQEVEFKSKYPMINLGETATLQKGRSITSKKLKQGTVKVVAGGTDFAYYHSDSNRPANVITVSASGANAGYVNFWNEPIFASDCTTIVSDSILKTKYIFYFLKIYQNIVTNLQKGQAQPHVYSEDLKTIKVPLPPLEIQKNIVSECEKIDAEYKQAQQEIKNCKNEIKSIFEESQKNATTTYKLSNKDLFEISIGKRVLSSEMNDNYDIPVYSANVFVPFGKINKLLIKNFEVPSVLWGIDGDWMVNVLPVGQKFYPTDHCGVLRIKGEQIEPKFVAMVLNNEGKIKGFERSYRASIDRVKAISITLPSLNIQTQCISQIDKLESKVEIAKKIMSAATNRKKVVLEKYLCETE